MPSGNIKHGDYELISKNAALCQVLFSLFLHINTAYICRVMGGAIYSHTPSFKIVFNSLDWDQFCVSIILFSLRIQF